MKKWWSLLVLLVVGVLGLVGCTSSESGGEENDSEGGQTEITYYSFSATPNYEDVLADIVTAFEEENPNIKVNTELTAYQDYFTKLQTRIAGGNAPDVFELNYENFVQYASKGTLADLSTMIEEDENFDPKQLNQEAFKAYQFEGKQYGMVESFSNVLTFYNKDLFDKAGVDYPTEDWTWEDELAAAEKITDEENNVWGTYAPVTMNEYFKIAAQNGGNLFDQDGNPTVDKEENLEALNYMVDKVNESGVSPSPAEMSGQAPADLFLNGQLGIVHTGIWMFDAFKDASFEWDVALEAGNTQKAHHFFANGLAVSADTDKKEAAYKFAAFMSASEEVAKLRVENSWELPAITNEDILQPYLEQTPPENRQAVFNALDTLVLPPAVDNWSKISDVTNQEFEKALNGDKTTEDVLKTLQSEYEQILSE
ncbi:extracellular solute-binding protein [Pontibacillus yanchengensis]|uniref:Extracellular solute-binding protein n=2 Tax=Pontibacillus yanchengensis TaxID=462910 RepID=A0A6I4ZSJ9_9BACI|nr:sugar ABC transporter substrate-binding protein [Pontibacillus yanchengensis]MYL32174.1 extracellular solute-binding protein [Pontibacillus yanchengensis]MYL52754.1 extracellular solute-binding protein [Pontibacillus yanchengensis]